MGDTHGASGATFNNPQVGVVGGAERNLVNGDGSDGMSQLERVDQVDMGDDVAEVEDMEVEELGMMC